MRAEELAAKMGARKSGTAWAALCPAHADSNPSLSIADGEKGFVVKCRAGCSQDAVVSALKARGFWPATERKATVYVIPLPAGGVVEHVREDFPGGKKIFWRRDGKNGLAGLNLTDIPLYIPGGRLPETGSVVVTEGEKAATAARNGLALPAVGTVTGAGVVPSIEVLSVLRGRDVLLWPDNDKPGAQHMANIARVLQDIAPSVRILEWPGAPENGDAADFVARGLTRADFDRLPSRFPGEREPGEDDEPRPSKRVTIGAQAGRAELLRRMDTYALTGSMPGAIPSGMRRLDGMLLGGFRPGKFYVLGGETGRGKTTLLMQWALHAAAYVETVGVITPEMDEDSLTERVLSTRTGYGIHDYRSSRPIVRPEWEHCALPQNIRASFDADDIATFADEERPGILIVDYAQQAVSYESERRHTALAMLGSLCLGIAKRNQVPVLLGTQVNVTAERDFSIRETRILEHQADAVIYIDITYDKQTDSDGRRQVKSQYLLVHKNRHGYAGRIPINWEASIFRFSEA